MHHKCLLLSYSVKYRSGRWNDRAQRSEHQADGIAECKEQKIQFLNNTCTLVLIMVTGDWNRFRVRRRSGPNSLQTRRAQAYMALDKTWTWWWHPCPACLSHLTLGLKQFAQPLKPVVRDNDSGFIGLDGAEGKVLRRDGQLGQGVEERGLANIRQADLF
jgi:hypothetical protein